jgi:Zn finger protein HypA/HybF involved in hydrogenase expression
MDIVNEFKKKSNVEVECQNCGTKFTLNLFDEKTKCPECEAIYIMSEEERAKAENAYKELQKFVDNINGTTINIKI